LKSIGWIRVTKTRHLNLDSMSRLRRFMSRLLLALFILSGLSCAGTINNSKTTQGVVAQYEKCGSFYSYSEERGVRQLYDDLRYGLGQTQCDGREFTGKLSLDFDKNGMKTCVSVNVQSMECADYARLNPYDYEPYEAQKRLYDASPVNETRYKEFTAYKGRDYYMNK